VIFDFGFSIWDSIANFGFSILDFGLKTHAFALAIADFRFWIEERQRICDCRFWVFDFGFDCQF